VKSIGGSVQSAAFVSVLLSFLLIFATLAPPAALAQAASQTGQGVKNSSEDGGKDKGMSEDFDKDDFTNPPPFDFSNDFYKANGIDVDQLNSEAGKRFGAFPGKGLFRKTGPPAGPNQVNWVIDNSNTDPDRNNVRILPPLGATRTTRAHPRSSFPSLLF